MNIFINVSNVMPRFANKKYIIPVFVLFVLVITVIEIGPFGTIKLKEISGGTGMLDMQFGYNPLQVNNMLDTIGAAGRQLYAKLLGLDFIFAVVFMLLQSLMITALLRKVESGGRFQILNMLPFLRSGLDIVENTFILLLLFYYPGQLPVVVSIASVFTISKWIVYIAIIALLLALGALTTRKALIAKINTQKQIEPE